MIRNGLRRGFVLLAGIMAYQVAIRVLRKTYHSPAPALYGPFLDSRLRRLIQPPAEIVARSGIRPGMRVLEIGCGSGAFTTIVARLVGAAGEVAALDIQPGMLAQLDRKLARPENQDIGNVRLYLSGAYELPFEAERFDAVYMVTVLPEIPDQARALAEVWRVLKPGGILAVSELLLDPDYPLRSTTVRIGAEAGFRPEATMGNLWNYTVRFRKPGV